MFLRKILSFSLTALGGRGLNLLRDITFTHFFGASIFTDLFYAAGKLPNLLKSFLADGAIHGYLTPQLSQESNTHQQTHILEGYLSHIMVINIIVITLFEVFSKPIANAMFPGFMGNPEKASHFLTMVRIVFPYILFTSTNAVLTSMHNALQVFWVQPFLRYIIDVNTIISFVVASYLDYHLVAQFLASMVLMGAFFQTLFLYCSLLKRKIYIKKLGFSTNELYTIMKALIMTALSTLSLHTYTFVDISFLSALPKGYGTYLALGEKLTIFMVEMLGVSISVVLLTNFSKLKNLKEKTQLLQDSVLFFCKYMLPIIFTICLFYPFIVKALFLRGKFGLQDCTNTSLVFSIWLVGIPFMILNRIFLNFFFSLKQNKLPMMLSLYTIAAEIMGKLYLFEYFGYLALPLVTCGVFWTVTAIYVIKIKRFCRLFTRTAFMFLLIHGGMAAAIGSIWSMVKS